MRNRQFYFPAVIIAGLVGIVPGLLTSPGSCCCTCGVLTALIGLLGVALVRRKSGGLPIEVGEASLIGLVSGGITGLLTVVLHLALRLGAQTWIAEQQADFTPQQMRLLEASNNPIGIVVTAVLLLLIHSCSGALGGLLAAPILKTGEGSAPPSPVA